MLIRRLRHLENETEIAPSKGIVDLCLLSCGYSLLTAGLGGGRPQTLGRGDGETPCRNRDTCFRCGLVFGMMELAEESHFSRVAKTSDADGQAFPMGKVLKQSLIYKGRRRLDVKIG